MEHDATIRGIGVGVGAEGAGPPAVLLEARGQIIPIFVAPEQAQTIENARQGTPAERPLTHDLFVDVLDDLNGTLDRVRIDDLTDGTYYAKLDFTVKRGDDHTQIVRDARPSDGIGLAVRIDCPITIADAVIDEAGQTPDQVGLGPTDVGASGASGAGTDIGVGTDPTDSGTSEEHESVDLDDAVDIDIDEADDTDADNGSES
jgi:bifunctional DNase/RNase